MNNLGAALKKIGMLLYISFSSEPFLISFFICTGTLIFFSLSQRGKKRGVNNIIGDNLLIM